MVNKPRVLWERESTEFGADLQRVQVWDAFSELFLDSYRTDEELQDLAEIIAISPFSIEELEHIFRWEVTPVCAPNLLWIVGGEGMMFSPRDLIPKCLAQQQKYPYEPGKVRRQSFFEAITPTAASGSLLGRVKRIRQIHAP
jgi:hypothetical protein